MNRLALVAAPAAVTLALVTAGGAAMTADAQAPRPASRHLEGVWVVTVDPDATPAGDPPPFESVLSYDDSFVVNEITSRGGGTSAGLGRWTRTGADTFHSSWQKYRFDGSGAYVGKTVISEDIEVDGTTYRARSVTSLLSPGGAVVARFESHAVGTRLDD